VFLYCYFYNHEQQIFCRPVPWATTVIIIFCVSFLILPFLTRQTILLKIISAFCGLGFFIAIYLLLFARQEYLIFVAFNIPIILILYFLLRFAKRKFKTNVFDAFYLYPAIVLTPFLLLFQLWLMLKNLETKTQKRLFIATPILTLIIALLLTFQINNILNRFNNATDKEKELKEIVKNPINNYLTELILGAHWKYHTELCLYDGWRPPFHDPILVIANKILFPFSMFDQKAGLPVKSQYYNKIYPDNPMEFDCKCAERQFGF
jgi:hypothetical protein